MELGCKTASRDRRKAENKQHGALRSWGSCRTQQDRGMLVGGEFGGWAVRLQVLVSGRFICCTKPGIGWIWLFVTNLMASELGSESWRHPVIPVHMGPCSPGIF